MLMATNPSTEVYLYKDVPFDPNNEHTVLWVTDDTKIGSYGTAEAKAEQEKYFTQTNKPSRSYSNYSYQRVGTNKIQIKDTYDNVSGHSYMRFRNQAHENKWWYCFITAVDYINENCTEVSYEVDLLQTYQFDWKLEQCFVEREHSLTDEIGDNITPESFNITEYEWERDSTLSGGGFGLLVSTTKALKLVDEGTGKYFEVGDNEAGSVSNGIFSAGGFIYVNLPDDIYAEITTDTPIYYSRTGALYPNVFNDEGKVRHAWQYVSAGLATLANAGALQSVYVCPKIFTNYQTYSSQFNPFPKPNFNKLETVFVPLGSEKIQQVYGITTQKKYDIAKPEKDKWKNGKTYTFPYMKLCLDDQHGNCKDFKYESFIGDKCHFAFFASIVNNPEVIGYPLNYNSYNKNWEVPDLLPGVYPVYEFTNPADIMILKGFPMCSVNVDAYNAWLVQQSYSETANILTSVGKGTIGGAIAGGPAGAVGGAIGTGVGAITNSLIRQNQLADLADTPTGTASSSIGVQADMLRFKIIKKQAKEQQLRQIDEFFTRFGYAQNRIKVPALHARRRFSYVKTIDANIDGNFTAQTRAKLEQIFNNGITFWASTHLNYFGEYQLPNECIYEG